MTVNKIFKTLMIASVVFSALYAGELKVKNDATIAVSVTVRAKENKAATNPFIITQIVNPGEEITVAIDEKRYSGTTFSVQASKVTSAPVAPLPSNECILSGYEGRVIITTTPDGSALVCGVTEVRN